MNWIATVKAKAGALSVDVHMNGTTQPVAIIGPNGAGKTTLLRIIAGVHPCHEGTIRVGEHTLYDGTKSVDLPPEKRNVGYVPQAYGLFPHLDVKDNVAFSLRARRRSIDPEVQDALIAMDLQSLATRKVSTLSGGEAQRVAIARAMVSRPQIFLWDEPLAAIDLGGKRAVRDRLARFLAQQARPALIVTHDPKDVEALCEKIYVMDAGRIVQEGAVADIRKAPANDFVREFFG